MLPSAADAHNVAARITDVDIKLDALDNAMHSGMFGGPAPDPVTALIHILASMHDADGNTTIDGLDRRDMVWVGLSARAVPRRLHVLDGVSLSVVALSLTCCGRASTSRRSGSTFPVDASTPRSSLRARPRVAEGAAAPARRTLFIS